VRRGLVGRFGDKIVLDIITEIGPNLEEIAMLKGITRIPPVDVETLPDDLRETLEEQEKLRGAPLYPYLFYARNAAYFRATSAMWTALSQETKRVPGPLRALLNRRVAWWNGCEF
jgi:alkylhydroperoxidase family enzyme